MMTVAIDGADKNKLLTIGTELQKRPEVEWVYIEHLSVPPPGDIPPTTPNFVNLQTYRGPNPGMNVDYLWLRNGRGQGIHLSDCEYGWNPSHEDLNDVIIHPNRARHLIPMYIPTDGTNMARPQWELPCHLLVAMV